MRIVAVAILFLAALAVIGYVGLKMASTRNWLGDRGRVMADRLGIDPITAEDVMATPDPEPQPNPPGPLGPSRPGTAVIDGIPPGFENVDVPDEPGGAAPGLTAEEAAAVQRALRSDPRLRGRDGYGARLDADRAFQRRSMSRDAVVGGRRRGSCALKHKLEGQLRESATRRMAPADR